MGVVDMAMRVSFRPTKICVEGCRIVGAAEFGLQGHVFKQCDLQRPRHRICNIGLELEHIAQVPVIGFRPEVKSGCSVDELRRDPHRVSRAATLPSRIEATFNWRAMEATLTSLSLKENADVRAATCNSLIRASALSNSSVSPSEVVLFLISAHVHERQYRD